MTLNPHPTPHPSPSSSPASSLLSARSEEPLNDNLVPFGESLYLLVEERTSYDDAEASCIGLGDGFGLAKIQSQAEQDFVFALAGMPDSSPIWISLRRFADGFRYGDGTPLEIALWADGEPNNYRESEDCGRIGHRFGRLGEDGSWFDADCTSRAWYICEGPGTLGCTGVSLCRFPSVSCFTFLHL